MEKMTDEELMTQITDRMEEAAAEEFCPGSAGSCQCLHVLRDTARRAAVASYCVFVECTITKRMTDQRIMDLIRTTKLAHGVGSQPHGSGPGRPPLKIGMPFDGCVETNDTGDDPTGEDRENKLQPLVDGNPMCINDVQKVYKIGRAHWLSIVASVDDGLMPPHGNTGKPT